jgi:hypothetical protein
VRHFTVPVVVRVLLFRNLAFAKAQKLIRDQIVLNTPGEHQPELGMRFRALLELPPLLVESSFAVAWFFTLT